MRAPFTWQEKRDWLQENFGSVSTEQRSTVNFVSRLTDAEVFNSGTRSALSRNGTSEEQCINRLFTAVTEHGGSEHLIKTGEGVERHVWVDIDLNVRPWAPLALAA